MGNEIFEEILVLIPDQMFPKDKERSRELRVEDDLRIYGDDAADFILRFSDRFSVDISDLVLDKYFTKETAFYFLAKRLSKRNRASLTLGDLEKAVIAGELK